MTTYGRMNGILLGGLIGGSAEVVAVALYALLAGAGGWVVAQGVSEATFGARFSGGDAVLVGLAVHFALSLAIAACMVLALPALLARVGRSGVVLVSAAALVGIWAMNFFIVLPRIAPEFVAMVPLWLSFLSKLSFGVALGLVLIGPGRFSASPRRTPA
jgi:hypothetical protein